MAGTPFGRGALAAAWLGGGLVFVALAVWGETESVAQAQFVRLGVVWMLFGLAQVVATSRPYRALVERRPPDRSWLRNALFGLGVALVLVGFVLSGRLLPALGFGGLLLVAVAVLAGR